MHHAVAEYLNLDGNNWTQYLCIFEEQGFIKKIVRWTQCLNTYFERQ